MKRTTKLHCGLSLFIGLAMATYLGACSPPPSSLEAHEKLCRVGVTVSMQPLEKAADDGKIEDYEIQIRHAEAVRRQTELMAELQAVAEDRALEILRDMPGDVEVSISFATLSSGETQRVEYIDYDDGKNIQTLNFWGERMWPTPQQKKWSKALGFDLQQDPLSVDDVLNAVRLWRGSHSAPVDGSR